MKGTGLWPADEMRQKFKREKARERVERKVSMQAAVEIIRLNDQLDIANAEIALRDDELARRASHLAKKTARIKMLCEMIEAKDAEILSLLKEKLRVRHLPLHPKEHDWALDRRCMCCGMTLEDVSADPDKRECLGV